MKTIARLAVIGGSGLYDMEEFADRREIRPRTPFGPPSGPLLAGRLGDVPCLFLPRHGRGHVLTPSEINGRANIFALKSLGVERIIAVGAVGSLQDDVKPRQLVFPDQIVDKTKHRPSTFFGAGVVAHVAFDEPFCSPQSEILARRAESLGLGAHRGGTYLCMEGPAFSTRAESMDHRRLGYAVVGMTALPEAKLAREAEICYSLAALVTDYDCWKPDDAVSSSQVMSVLRDNVSNVRRLISAAVPEIASRKRDCRCARALHDAIVTDPRLASKSTLRRLSPLIGRRPS